MTHPLRKAAQGQPSLARYVAALRDMPCMVCGCKPVSLHHPVGGSMLARIGCRGARKCSDWLQIPLHWEFHQGPNGLHTIGVETWESRYGTQASMIDKLCERFQLNLWELAKKPSKILPHRGVEML